MLSIIVPVHNSSMYLEKCIGSILGQSYKDIELILVENSSTDNSLQICEKYQEKDSRIKVIVVKEKGAARARNCGIRVANGEYITFVDSDDYLHENAYEILLNKLKKTKADAICYSYKYVCEDGEDLQWYEPRLSKYEKECFSGIETVKIFLTSKDIEGFCWNKIFRMDFFKSNNIFFEENKTAYEDMAIMFDALLACNSVVFCSEKLYFYRQVKNSLTHSDYDRKNIEYDNSVQHIINSAKKIGILKEIAIYKISREIWSLYEQYKIGKRDLTLSGNIINVLWTLFIGLRAEKYKTMLKAFIIYIS